MEELVIGVIRGAHGVDGAVRVESLSDEASHFRRLKWVCLERDGRRSKYDVKRVEEISRGLLVTLEGVTSPEDAAALVGSEILVPRRRASRRRWGEYYAADLIGSRVIQQGSEVGSVVGILSTHASELLEIRRPSGEILLVPFVRAFVGRVRPRSKTVELKTSWNLE